MKAILLSSVFVFLFYFNALSQSKIQDKKAIHLAREYFRIEDYAHAKEYYEQLAKEHPENEHFNYYLGVCYFKLGDTDKALSYFKKTSSGITKSSDYEF